MPNQHYVYLHHRATDGKIFYVGKGKDRRAWSKTGRNKWWRAIERKHSLSVTILRDQMSEHCALTLERIAIRQLGIHSLANLVDGGGGIPGWKHSDDARRRIAAASKGRAPTAKQLAALDSRGRSATDAQRQRMSAAKKGKKRGPLPALTRAKISASHMGMRPSADALRKMRAAKIGKAQGKLSPTYDHAVRVFEHAEHGQFVGTRADLITRYSLAAGCISTMINGGRKSVKGWRLK